MRSIFTFFAALVIGILIQTDLSEASIGQLLSDITSDGYQLLSSDVLELVNIPSAYGVVGDGVVGDVVGPVAAVAAPTGYLTLYLYQGTCQATAVAFDVSIPTGVCFSSSVMSSIITVGALSFTVYAYSGPNCASYIGYVTVPFKNPTCLSPFMLAYSTTLPGAPGYGTIYQ
jgi:hypothetical protein